MPLGMAGSVGAVGAGRLMTGRCWGVAIGGPGAFAPMLEARRSWLTSQPEPAYSVWLFLTKLPAGVGQFKMRASKLIAGWVLIMERNLCAF